MLHHAAKMETLGLFVAGITHDLNNGLTPIRGYYNLIEKAWMGGELTDDNLSTWLSKGFKAIGSVEELVSMVRDFSRKDDSGSFDYFDLTAAIPDWLKFLGIMISNNCSLAPDLVETECWVSGNFVRLQQVVNNLVLNAGDAMPYGGKIRISTGIMPVTDLREAFPEPVKPGRYVKLSVKDSGIGIEPDNTLLDTSI